MSKNWQFSFALGLLTFISISTTADSPTNRRIFTDWSGSDARMPKYYGAWIQYRRESLTAAAKGKHSSVDF